MKKIVSGCIEKILEFDRQKEAAEYIEDLRKNKRPYMVINRENLEYGRCRIRIKESYYGNPMLYD